MPIETIGNFSVKKISVMDMKGEVDSSLMPSLSMKEIDIIYRQMKLSRLFDEKCIKLQRQGRLGTYAPCIGQEASSLGTAFALKESDWLFPAYRENCALFFRGYPMENLLLFWMGFEAGNNPGDSNSFPMCLPIATHLPYAVGFALGCKLKKMDCVSMVYFGDGATSEGDFHEAMNFAGVFKLPIIFVCQNNGWAISTPVEKQTASKSIAQKAIAYGFDGIQVDGNDIFAVICAGRIAVKNAREFKPTLIECLTYRVSPHTTADDPTKYSSKSVTDNWKEKDPIICLKIYMEKNGLFSEDYENSVIKDCEEIIRKAVELAEKFKDEPNNIFNYVYSELPWVLKEQMNILEEMRK